MTWRSALQAARIRLSGLLHRPDPPVTIDLTEASRRQAIRDAEWSARADAEARVLRTSAGCRQAERRQVTAVVERRRVPRGDMEGV